MDEELQLQEEGSFEDPEIIISEEEDLKTAHKKIRLLESKVKELEELLHGKLKIFDKLFISTKESLILQQKLSSDNVTRFNRVLNDWLDAGIDKSPIIKSKRISKNFENEIQDISPLHDSTTSSRLRRRKMRIQKKNDDFVDEFNSDDDGQVSIKYDDGILDGVRVLVEAEFSDASDASAISTKKKSKKSKQKKASHSSTIWSLFKINEDGKSAECKLCEEKGEIRVLKMFGTTSTNLHNHLKSVHKYIVKGEDVLPLSDPKVEPSERISPYKQRKKSEKMNGGVRESKRSITWDHFTKFEEDGVKFARCNVCEKEGLSKVFKMPASATTSGLLNHLKISHCSNL